MKWLKLWEKIGKQPLGITQHNDVTVFADGKEFFVTGIKYDSGKPIGLDTIEICCQTCEFCDKEVPHTCDICDSLDTPDYYMWSRKIVNL